MNRRAPIAFGLVGALAGIALALPGGHAAAAGELAVQRAILGDGTITHVVHNGSTESATLAQVSPGRAARPTR